MKLSEVTDVGMPNFLVREKTPEAFYNQRFVNKTLAGVIIENWPRYYMISYQNLDICAKY